MTKKNIWFIKKRGSYLPCSIQGWITYIPYIGYLVSSAIIVNIHTGTVVDLLYGIVPQWVAATVVLTWIAGKRS
jgi:hypothetical protein